MKTAISLPDDLFRSAEKEARRLRVSRSELYAKAIAAFLEKHNQDAITERLNQVYSRHSSELDPGLHRAQMRSLPKEKW
jgi:metal-responsive CopG/Arc/MetJ family transcriptional regulator